MDTAQKSYDGTLGCSLSCSAYSQCHVFQRGRDICLVKVEVSVRFFNFWRLSSSVLAAGGIRLSLRKKSLLAYFNFTEYNHIPRKGRLLHL